MAAPAAGVTQFTAQHRRAAPQVGTAWRVLRLHFFARGASAQPLQRSRPSSLLPPGWLSAMPGHTMVGSHAKLVLIGDDAAGRRPRWPSTSKATSVVGARHRRWRGLRLHRLPHPRRRLSRASAASRDARPDARARPAACCSACSRSRPTACWRCWRCRSRAGSRRASLAIERALADAHRRHRARRAATTRTLLHELTRAGRRGRERAVGQPVPLRRLPRPTSSWCTRASRELREARIAGTADHRGIHGAPLHARGGHLQHRLAAAARPVRARGAGQRAAGHARGHRARDAEPGAAGVDGPPRQAAAAAAADGRRPVGGGHRLLRGRAGGLPGQGRQGRPACRSNADLIVGLAHPGARRRWRCWPSVARAAHRSGRPSAARS
ncbi:MAG: hypothetical protein MZW92_22280 [Comamonadaceae bacterium]|nr:hypothetical protein [Comamonadaceae bacterium]